MKRLVILGAVLLISQNAAVGGVLGGTGVSIDSEIGIYSSYIWRGFELNDEPVQQVGVEASYGILTLGLWTSSDLTYKEDGQSNEIDYYLDVNKEVGDFSFSAGYTYYVFPYDESYTGEFSLGISYDTFLSPSFTWFRDHIDGEGNYFYSDLTLPLASDESFSADLVLGAGINDDLFIDGQGGDIFISAEFSLPLYEGMELSPSLLYAIPFGDMTDYEDNSFCAGITLGYGF